MLVLGIETSCDETAIGIVDPDAPTGARLCAHALATQIEAHKPYGGVVPEIAARAHLDRIEDLLTDALKQAGIPLNRIDGFAATCGPGLIGGVMVGAMTGKALAVVQEKPFIAINHLEAHALTVRLSYDVGFPYLLLLMSGGHCQIVLVEGLGCYRQLGTTLDDAVGECFDKSAKILGLGYPGGPLIEQVAALGNPCAFTLPRPLCGDSSRTGCDFSFSGLKTAVRHEIMKRAPDERSPSFISDIAASLQKTIGDILVNRTTKAFDIINNTRIQALVVGGGVAANKALRSRLTELANSRKVPFLAPPPELCTDNGVMIAWAGAERLTLGQTSPFDTRCRPRWPLESLCG